MSRAYYASFRQLVVVCSTMGFDASARSDGSLPQASVHKRLNDFLRASPRPVLKRIGYRLIRTSFDLRVLADYEFHRPIRQAEAHEALLTAQAIRNWLEDAGLIATA